VDTVGGRLRQARLARNLEVDEVAEATRIRPERIVDLEADQYGNFPNLAYAKSFLTKYAQYLKVDIRRDLENFRVSHSISLEEYPYLASAPARRSVGDRHKITPRGFRVPPLVVLALVLIVLVGIPFFSYLTLSISRLREKSDVGSSNESPSPVSLVAKQTDPPSASEDASRSPTPATGATVSAEKQSNSVSSPSEEDQKSGPDRYVSRGRDPAGVEVRRALPADPGLNADSSPKPEATPLVDKKLEVRLLKRTWVRVTRDLEGNQPVYEGFVGPDSKPILVVGKKFWVRVLDKNAVEVKKDGQLVIGSSDDIVIN
jgi:cytoskeletal protein RodZ